MTNEVRRGTLLSFDSSAWTAYVYLDGADAESLLPVGQWVPTAMLTPGAELAVLVFGDTNTDDGVVLGAYGAVGSLSTSGSPTFGGLTINTSTSADPLIITVDGLPAGIQLTTYRSNINQSRLTAKSARGSLAVPVASSSGDILFGITANGYETNTPAFGAAGPFLRYVTNEAWTNAAQGANLQIFTTPPGSTVQALTAQFSGGGTGKLSLLGAAGLLQVNGIQVVTARQTGWTAPTATLSRTAVANADTLAQTISHLAALITDLTTHGLIGP
jgi:hypothetical protein